MVCEQNTLEGEMICPAAEESKVGYLGRSGLPTTVCEDGGDDVG
jgi:hypothetical protein